MRNKRIVGPDRVKNVTWEPDYDDDAWIDFTTDTPPTRETHPGAFYRVVHPAYPVAEVVSARKRPHRKLTRTQLRKRLSAAGLSGAQLLDTVDRVMAGPTLEDLTEMASRGGLNLFMRWDTEQLKTLLGERVARRVLRFVSTMFVVRDEYWDLVKPLMPSFAALFYQARSFNAQLVTAPQDVKELPGAHIALPAPATLAA
ncbi:hypothetical protein G3A43_08345 [Paraburkholderia aspalathi]|nr:hypothetical protein [Paraburkholderia aspalathi]MBK3780266.1 hypothetical protein [Paraburkholderia aspalathi]